MLTLINQLCLQEVAIIENATKNVPQNSVKLKSVINANIIQSARIGQIIIMSNGRPTAVKSLLMQKLYCEKCANDKTSKYKILCTMKLI